MDLRDLWRTDDDGRPRLTLRQVWVRVRRLPHNSALAIDDNGGQMPFTMTENLLADIWLIDARVHSKKSKAPKDHPAREKQRKTRAVGQAERKRGAFERAKARNAERLARTNQ
ncbi:hypothetical protein [Rhodococcus sp. MALMAid1271]|uniref:hypothetical protein n=1 Tax=Rhodococcus sp. MALMAid1271 TaxID=3411744 RepID=UPI003BA350C1